MNFLKENRRFSFIYEGKSIDECACSVSSQQSGNTLTTVYLFEDGLKVTNVARKIEEFGAYEWVNWLENTSDKPTGQITELYDADFSMPMEHENPRFSQAYLPSAEHATKVYAPIGSTWAADEFYCNADEACGNNSRYHIYPGCSKSYSTSGGRSSEARAPFFNVIKNNAGVIFAIGWSGQWNCRITRGEDDIGVKTKIEDTDFYLNPGEKIRTSSIVVMPYEGGFTASQNKWRRLVKAEFSLVGKPGREACGAFSASIWGGMKTADALSRVKAIEKNGLLFDHIWMDAGWYGESTEPTPDEFEGDWPQHTGDWVVSPKIHPGGLVDFSDAIHSGGRRFILWFEPERVIKSTPIARAHPEYFIERSKEESNLLLNLGREDAWNYCFNTLAELIGKLGVDFYRQDFNFDPLKSWRFADAEGRRGITEIKHIMGLYRLWDALLAKFPHLMIDNCASGGRRIDIETLRRSIPLWRSDCMCPANFSPELAQGHTLSFNLWMPYSGTGTGRVYDIYNMRSAYAPALTTNYTFSQRESFGGDEEKMQLLKRFTQEYIRVRPYLSEDFYPLTQLSDKSDVWCAAQFDRPEQGDGVIQVFRRATSPYSRADFILGNVRKNACYTFTDADDACSFTLTGEQLIENGLAINIDKPRTAKLFFYTVAEQ